MFTSLLIFVEGLVLGIRIYLEYKQITKQTNKQTNAEKKKERKKTFTLY